MRVHQPQPMFKFKVLRFTHTPIHLGGTRLIACVDIMRDVPKQLYEPALYGSLIPSVALHVK